MDEKSGKTEGAGSRSLKKVPLALPRLMIERAARGADKLTECIPVDGYDDDTVYLLFHGNANASYAVMDRIAKYEVAFSPALRRVIGAWLELNRSAHADLVGEERRLATHQAFFPKINTYPVDMENEVGSTVTVLTHWYKEKTLGDFSRRTFFGEWMMEVWAWWGGRINQLERMYLAELKRSGDAQ